MTPPAYGTLGDATRGMFVGNHYQNVDASLEKTWRIKEQYTVQIRVEAYNAFNHVNPAQFSSGSATQTDANPASGGGAIVSGTTAFGFHNSAVGGGNSNRQFQFGLKIGF